MNKKTFVLPTLSALVLSTALLSGTVKADETVGSETSIPETTVLNDTSRETMPISTADSAPETAVEEKQADELTTIDVLEGVVFHTNDIHGRIEESKGVIGFAKEATIIAEERSKNPETTFLFDAGDAFQGLPITNSSKGEDVAKIMNELGYDAMTLGNHEFDFGLDQLKKLDQILNFPLISANVYVDGARLFEASTIIDKNKKVVGDEIVVIGVTTPETATKTHPKNVANVTFTDPITEVTNVIAEVEARAKATGSVYNTYVILAHLGIDTTTPTEWQGKTLAEALSKNELLKNKRVLVIDGHSHTLDTATYGNVTYNQTGSYLNNLGKITLTSKAVLAGVIPDSETKDVVANEKVAELVSAAKERLEAENSVVIVEKSTTELNGDRMNVRVRETNLGNAVTDSLLAYGQTGFSHPSDLAVTNGGGLRETIQKDAPVTRGDVIAVLPFGNTISQIAVKGQQIKEMFSKSFGSILQMTQDGKPVLDENGQPLLEPSGGFLQISGAVVYYDTKLPAVERVLGVQIYDRDTKTYRDLDPEKTYYLVTNDFLAAGGDGYTMLGGAREEGPSMDVAFGDYLASADLTKYAVINPNLRGVAIDKSKDSDGDGVADYLELMAKTKVDDAEDYPGKVVKPVDKEEQKIIENQDNTTKDKNHTLQKYDNSSAVTSKENEQKTFSEVQGNDSYRPYVKQMLSSMADQKTQKVESVTVPVSYATKSQAKQLPLTSSKESLLASLVGLTVATYGIYGMRKKTRKL